VATAANNLLLRKDMCNWSKGMQIRWVYYVAAEVSLLCSS